MIMQLAIGSIILALAYFFYIIFSCVKLKGVANNQADRDAARMLDKENRNRIMKNINEVTKTFNLKTIMSTVTESMYYSTECLVNVLKKLGIRKEVEVQIDEAMENAGTDFSLVMSDGKNNMMVENIPCRYTETYIDNVSEKVLLKKEYEKAYFNLELLKSDCMERQSAHFCSNCGAPMEINGDFFLCGSCNTKYTTESYNWVVTNAYAYNVKKGNVQAFLYMVPVFLVILMGFIGTVGGVMMSVVSVLCDLVFLAVVFFYGKSLKDKMHYFSVMTEYDPNISKKAFEKRLHYLVRLYERAKDFDINRLKSFMEPKLFEKVKAENTYDEFYFLDMEVDRTYLTNFRIEGDKQIADAKIRMVKTTMNEKKKVRSRKEEISFSVYRHKDCLTDIKKNAEVFTCESCGSSVNLSLDGKCRYCGETFDVSKYDWIIYQVQG